MEDNKEKINSGGKISNEMENKTTEKEKIYAMVMTTIVAGALLAIVFVYNFLQNPSKTVFGKNTIQNISISELEESVLPSVGVVLPVSWGDLGKRLVASGVIDEEKIKALYESRGQFTEEYKQLLTGTSNGKLKINQDNAGYILNLLWALGLANKNPILENGEMMDPRYSGSNPPAGGFASTGGWTMAKGNAMDHYSHHKFFDLTPEEQAIVERASRGIYRPCCGNSTHFPDCNHGMAMLGLLELVASQGVSEQDMYKAALTVNSYWFPDTYITIATYMKNKGIQWENVSPQEVLGINYSSGSGYAKISAQVQQQGGQKGGSCGV